MTRQLEPYINQERALHDLESVSLALRAWHRFKNTDSKMIDRYRSHDLLTAKTEFTNMHYHLEPGLRIQIHTGDEPVEGSTFVKGAYDMISERREPVEPGSTIDFIRIDEMQWNEGWGVKPYTTFYVGSYAVLLSLPSLAETLSVGGNLSLTEITEATPERS